MTKITKLIEQFLLIFFFFAVIFAIPVLTKLEKPKELSISENRYLAACPRLSLENIMEGRYFRDWETYLSDHIWRRDYWLFADTVIELAAGHRVVRDVVITHAALLPYVAADSPDDFAEATASAMAEKYKALSEYTAQAGGVFLYVNVPEQCSMLSYAYPVGLFTGGLRYNSQNGAFAAAMDSLGVNYLDMRQIFEISSADGTGSEYYARTDHHYNMRGAYLTYLTVCEALSSPGAEVIAKTDAVFAELPNTFNGSRGRKIYNLTSHSDMLEYILWDSPVAFSRSDNGNYGSPQVYFMPLSPGEEVSYNFYMGGDIAETIIETGRPHLPSIVIFGDSFTNVLETVLYTSFNTTVSLDFRHINTKTIYDYIDEFKPDFVVCLRDDTATLSSDGNGNLPLKAPARGAGQ